MTMGMMGIGDVNMAKSKTSPTQRTLRTLREQGVICEPVEKWNPWARVRQDLFGFADVLALCVGDDKPFVAIQCTDSTHHANRRTKILANTIAADWARCGGRVEVWSWGLVKKQRGGKQKIWRPRVEVITAEMFDG